MGLSTEQPLRRVMHRAGDGELVGTEVIENLRTHVLVNNCQDIDFVKCI